MNTDTDILKGKYAILKIDFIPESQFWETGYWKIKKGTKVYINGNECDGTCYIEYLECGFSINVNKLSMIN